MIAVRERMPSDDPFIFKSWLRSCRKSLRGSRSPADVYFAEMHKEVEGILPYAKTLVATDVSDQDFLIGFICTSKLEAVTSILHFVYVKRELRKYEVARCLAQKSGLDLAKPFFYTHETQLTGRLKRKFPLAIYKRDVLNILG